MSVIFIPFVATGGVSYPPVLYVSAPGSMEYEGAYTKMTEMWNGKPLYGTGSQQYIQWEEFGVYAGKWVIGHPDDGVFYVSETNDLFATWTVGPNGMMPAPTVTAA